MITRWGMPEVIYQKKIRELGISDELFYSLPIEIQKALALVVFGWESNQKRNNQDNVGEKTKEKVLKLFKTKR